MTFKNTNHALAKSQVFSAHIPIYLFVLIKNKMPKYIYKEVLVFVAVSSHLTYLSCKYITGYVSCVLPIYIIITITCILV